MEKFGVTKRVSKLSSHMGKGKRPEEGKEWGLILGANRA